MRASRSILIVAIALAAANLSADDVSHQQPGNEKHPVIFGVVQDVSVDGDNVIIHLYRERYEVLTVTWLRVRTSDDLEIYAPDLQNQDSVKISGDFDREGSVFTPRHITLTSRIEHR